MADATEDAGFIERMVINKARQTVTEVFGEFSTDDVQHAIMVDAPLVKNRAPEEYTEKLERRGSNYEGIFEKYVHPDVVWEWLEDPSWAPAEDVEADLRELRDTIEGTPGGKEWFADQIYDVWEMAGLEPPEDRHSID